jgi:hypothetical protein
VAVLGAEGRFGSGHPGSGAEIQTHQRSKRWLSANGEAGPSWLPICVRIANLTGFTYALLLERGAHEEDQPTETAVLAANNWLP